MKWNDQYEIGKGYESLFEFDSEKEEYMHDASVIMLRFFNELEKIHGPIKKKDLALKMGTSASYVTQLFRGDKIINLSMIAKLEKAFGVQFHIQAKKQVFSYEENFKHMDMQDLIDQKLMKAKAPTVGKQTAKKGKA